DEDAEESRIRLDHAEVAAEVVGHGGEGSTGSGKEVRDDLRDFREITVERQDLESVLQRRRRDPDVVRRDRRAAASKRVGDDCVAFGGDLVDFEDLDTRRRHEIVEVGPVLSTLYAA